MLKTRVVEKRGSRIKVTKSVLGTPQGGIASPLLSNIMLHELDCYMERRIKEYGLGRERRINPE